MFFTPELLASRDSGFGLLWLAATLGSKSTFKKLPKRSILTADIVQLCDLIAQPSEPLALRLSSNLLVGVARVYKVKQEILMSDVTTCFASLKKEVQELQSAGVMDARLQMDQASVRPSAVTLTANLRVMIAMDFDALVADWDEYLNIGGQSVPDGDSGDEYFDPAEARTKKKANALKALKTQPPSGVENARAEMHTLTEHHDHLLSASFDVSFLGPEEGVPGPSSSQAADFGFDDAFFAPSDGLDIGGLADELAEELGWTISKQVTGHAVEDGDINPDFNFNIEEMPGSGIDRASSPNGVAGATRRHRSLKRKANGMDDDNYMDPELINSTPFRGVSPATSFSRLLLSQDEQPMPLNDITLLDQNQVNTGVKKMKKMRLLLDARTELTDTELKAARAQYIEAQGLLKREIGQKKTEKNYGRTLEKRVWGVPNCIHAPALVDFWQESFKVQVEARTGTLHIHQVEGTPPRKRQKVQNGFEEGLPFSKEDIIPGPFDDKDMSINTDPPNDFEDMAFPNLRSSEEPGQGRRASRAGSVLADVGFDLGIQNPNSGSQKSSLFPWDNAGGSSSSGAFGMPGSDANLHVDHVEIRMRGSSQGRRDSSLVPSQVGSLVGGPGFSPAPMLRRSSQALGEDYAFEVEMQDQSVNFESQQSDINLISLERNSFNFLEYAKMQSHSLPSLTTNLTFDIVVPQLTSTRHVAASAFYHCLVLATKNLLRLKQTDPHGQVIITVVS